MTNVIVRYVRARAGDDRGRPTLLAASASSARRPVLEDPPQLEHPRRGDRPASRRRPRSPGTATSAATSARRCSASTTAPTWPTSCGHSARPASSCATSPRRRPSSPPCSSIEPLEVGDAHAVVRAITRPGFLRHPYLCDFTKGLLSQVPVLFGLVPAVVTETECQARGGRFCLYSVAWEAGQWSTFVDERGQPLHDGLGRRRGGRGPLGDRARRPTPASPPSRTRCRQMTERLEERLLDRLPTCWPSTTSTSSSTRITRRAADAVNAPRYLLVVQHLARRTRPAPPPRVRRRSRPRQLAQELLEEHPDDAGRLPAHRRHRLVPTALRPAGRGLPRRACSFFAQEQRDLSPSTPTTRPPPSTSSPPSTTPGAPTPRPGALLDFSRALSGVGTIDEVAQTLADTVPAWPAASAPRSCSWDPEAETLAVLRLQVDRPGRRSGRHAERGGAPRRRAPRRPSRPADTPLVDHAASSSREILVIDQRHRPTRSSTRVLERLAARRVSVHGPAVRRRRVPRHRDRRLRAPDGSTGCAPDRDLHERLTGPGRPGGDGAAERPAARAGRPPGLARRAHRAAQPPPARGPGATSSCSGRGARASRLCLFFVDLDRFKYGQRHAGPRAPATSSSARSPHRLVETVRRQDTVARLGGDEFAVLLPGLVASPTSCAAAGRADARGPGASPTWWTGARCRSSASIGIASSPEHGDTYDELLSHADDGHVPLQGTWAATPSGSSRPKARATRGRGPARGRPAARPSTSQGAVRPLPALHRPPEPPVVGVEALVRWRHPNEGVIEPAPFIPRPRPRTSSSPSTAAWSARPAARCGGWADAGVPPLRLSRQRDRAATWPDDGFVDAVRRGPRRRTASTPDALELEIAERIMPDGDGACRRNVERAPGRLGVRFSIDDFGTGPLRASSRSAAFPVIHPQDRPVLRPGPRARPTSRPRSVSAIIAMAERLGLDCVAEGVETSHQSRILLQRGCTTAQGFFFSPPSFPGDVGADARGAPGPAPGHGPRRPPAARARHPPALRPAGRGAGHGPRPRWPTLPDQRFCDQRARRARRQARRRGGPSPIQARTGG